jgi:hypothetical protein
MIWLALLAIAAAIIGLNLTPRQPDDPEEYPWP